MAFNTPRKARRNTPQATNRFTTLPAAPRGMDGRVSLAQESPETAVYTYNAQASEYGLRIRDGYREYAIDCDNGSSTGIETIIPFESTEGLTSDRLFAVTNEGIWDVTTFDSPVFKLGFTVTGGDAGKGVYTRYVTDAGDVIMFYADGENGLFSYDQNTDSWAQTAGITFPDAVVIEDIRFIAVHKLRIWLVPRDNTNGYYLPINSIAGASKRFGFGNQFQKGGELAGLYNWSVDGGDGADDYLVAISNAGDVVPYRGSDPEATVGQIWENTGVYFIGEVAAGKRCAAEVGGNLYLLSIYGITNMSDLLQGVDSSQISRTQGLSGKSSFILRSDIMQYPIREDWDIRFLPSKASLIISSPVRDDGRYLQYIYYQPTDTFGLWRDVPMTAFGELRSNVFVGTADNRVLAMDVPVDDVKITPPSEGRNGSDVKFSVLMQPSSLDASGAFKRIVAVRPDFLSDADLNYEVAIRYDYVIKDFTAPLADAPAGNSEWDVSNWDEAVWGNSEQLNYNQVLGANGTGRKISVAIQGAAQSGTLLVSYDIIWNSGGAM